MRFISLATALVASSLLWAAPAQATAPGCGSTITSDTTLTADLSCPGDGLGIAAANVTLDLAGHSISGPGFEFGSLSAGVRLLSGAAGVKVRHGRIKGFGYGIDVGAGADRADVSGLILSDSAHGLRVASDASGVHGNLFMRNGGASQIGGDGNRFEGNAVRAKGGGVFALGSNNVTIRANSIVANGEHDPGITIGLGRGASVSANSVSGILAGTGIRVLDGLDSEVSANQVFGNGEGIVASGRGIRVSGNLVFSNLDDGIKVQPDRGAGVLIAGNVAIGNGNLGIEAPAGSDGGDNRAFGNGNPLQCIGVACS